MRESVTGFYRAAWAFYLVLAIAGLVGLVALDRPIGPELFARDPANVVALAIDLARGIAAAAALLLGWTIARRFSSAAREVETTLAALLGNLTRSEAVALALISALGEEIAFRGALQEWLGLVPAALLFALLHVGPSVRFLPWTLFALAGGLAFGGLVAWSGALGAAIVAHLLVNLVQLLRLAASGGRAPAPNAPHGN